MLSLFASGPGAWKKVGESAQGRVPFAKPPRVDRPQLLADRCCLCVAGRHHPGMQSLGPETDTGGGRRRGASGLQLKPHC